MPATRQNGPPTDNGFFVPFKGFDRHPLQPRIKPLGRGSVIGEILMRRHLDNEEVNLDSVGVDFSNLAHMPIAELIWTRRLRTLRRAVYRQGQAVNPIASRALYYLVNVPRVMRKLPLETRNALLDAVKIPMSNDFRHTIVGLRKGTLDYTVKHGLAEIYLNSALGESEQIQVGVERLGTSTNVVTVKSRIDKLLRLVLTNKLGVTGDHIQITMTRLPVSAAGPTVQPQTWLGRFGRDQRWCAHGGQSRDHR